MTRHANMYLMPAIIHINLVMQMCGVITVDVHSSRLFELVLRYGQKCGLILLQTNRLHEPRGNFRSESSSETIVQNRTVSPCSSGV